jgi:AcrR family transcriptional regulator
MVSAWFGCGSGKAGGWCRTKVKGKISFHYFPPSGEPMSTSPEKLPEVRPGRPRKGEEAVRRDQLLEHAVRLFAEHGYGQLSLETIAREARVSLRTIYRHFGGKAELFGAVIRHYSDLFAAALPLEPQSDRPFEEVLVDFGREYLFQLTRRDLVRLRAQLLAEAHRFPELAEEFYAEGPSRTLDRLARFLALQQQAGRLVEADPWFLAGQLVNSLRGERFQRLQLGLEPTPDSADIEPWARRAVELFLGGCRTGGVRPD